MSPTKFRGLVLFSVLLEIGSATVDLLIPDLLSNSLSQALENEPLPSVLNNLWLSFLLFVPWLVITLVSTVGLLFFKGWARTLSLYSTVFSLGLYPFLGPALTSGWSSALSEASFMIWGAVLALAYYSPLADRFMVKKDAQ
ncbi:MAG TPA: hypothetical protein VM532_02790 [Burkholderiales bacterium]|nr:hypothetical protein [Burkholderiales bacterium]